MKSVVFLLLASFSLDAADAPESAKHSPPPLPAATKTEMGSASAASKSYYAIDPKNRAEDLIQAYDLLKKEKPTLKIFMRTASVALIANIIDITAASKGTILFVKVQSNLGPKTMVIPVEDVLEIYYSS